jgi:hypothetical protein
MKRERVVQVVLGLMGLFYLSWFIPAVLSRPFSEPRFAER